MRHLIFLVAVTLISQSAYGAPPSFNDADLCKAAIATNNGRSPKIIKVESSYDGVVEVSYVRPSDGKRFRYWCKIETAEIRWRDEYIGRWAQNTRVYYRFLDNGKKIEVRSVFAGEENKPDIEIFREGDLK